MQQTKWANFQLQELFYIVGTKSLDSNAIDFLDNGINFVGRTFEDNGIQGKIKKQDFEPNAPYTITATVIGNYKYVKFQEQPYYCSQNINKLTPKPIISKWNKKIAYFFVANVQKFVSLYNGQQGGYKLDDIKKHVILLPTHNGAIDFAFMETFIAELEAQSIAELEAYLTITGLKDYTLTEEEEKVLNSLDKVQWKEYNLNDLYGNATRGKRLKSADRITGKLPFVTAGEADTGISDFIGNKVTIFSENTTTIDMFGSAKYRNYSYGGDDHIAVVHTEKVPKYAAIFVTSAIHKVSYAGQFSYSRNFYAKDADELNIFLPTKNGTPDYDFMNTYISAIHKVVIKEVVLYAEKKIQATQEAIK
ncbi:restriction endonuclease subunit S [Capnocytophaga periodontitidis]|uniref:restriction endonuclease subunit S n=1 Tax=Capnocytophaga periodontitidis TaxID=2795027 RepID=UPI0018E19E4B|nr:restriction endonuclease subunit S [Capnocytophaga periodontitidis]MBI1667924.1 restriction endonuclease subunit S [Capnocytophaga periodontitidis]